MTAVLRPVILGLETSCDETAAAVVEAGVRVRSNIIATQHDLHERYSGVVPEIASRAHLERLVPVVREALAEAGLFAPDLDAVAVGHRPGLIGSLLVGTAAAKALAWSLGVPLIGVDHIVAHLHAASLDGGEVAHPALGLVVSGGHTTLFIVRSSLDVERIGRTFDDAVGEAFDKAATILGLGYPGGPALDRAARRGDDRAVEFPVARARARGESLDFSFSGLKTALLYAACGPPRPGRAGPRYGAAAAEGLSDRRRDDLAASFERAAVAALVKTVGRALDRHDVRGLIVGGGVSANTRLRAEFTALARERRLPLHLPPPCYCLDNAAMIAGLAAAKYLAGRFDDWTLSAATGSALEGARVLV